ncbi:hypothetical protein K443DRAFT_284543 [Laccaria amethystina LaAM-08-1]|uniref:Uncharacterized protein n=1 Tax=Laccaria amethystina LaAM-08-1 TaxID=1095629 RepID=A0A0C9XFD7_9AGAR|nr:hypothetical protein K443DRAFT_284543 [Laccaria amethystina LaAM-08-1]
MTRSDGVLLMSASIRCLSTGLYAVQRRFAGAETTWSDIRLLLPFPTTPQHQQLLLNHENGRIRTCCMRRKHRTMTGSSSDLGLDSLSIPCSDVSALSLTLSGCSSINVFLERQEGTYLNALRGLGSGGRRRGVPISHSRKFEGE